MKIIIPVAGIGSKLRPHTHTQPKALMPVAGKAILAHIIDHLAGSGLKDFVFVTGYMGDKIELFVAEKYPDLKTTFIVQEPREGIGHAIWLTKKEVKQDEEVLIVLGDTFIDIDLKKIISHSGSLLGVKKVEDPRQFGVAELDNDGFISRLTEKPMIPKSNFALVGIYKIKESGKLFEALEYNIKNKIKTQDEYHLTDALQRMIEGGVKISTFQVGNWYDCGSKESLLETNAILLKRVNGNGKKSYSFPNTIIIPPVSIAEHCDITDSIIGPNVTIGDNAKVCSSIVSESIIGAYSHLETVVLHQSVVGSDAFLKGMKQSLNIGDSTEIDFS
jgi:glucose-1-phosphate thymidylyltransferase